MSGVLAARIGDEVGHSSASIGAWLGAAAGLLLAGAIVAFTGGAALVVVGALVAGGAGGALAGIHIGESEEARSTCSTITTGSPNTKIELRWAARADQDIDGHDSELVAQGSLRVLVNKKNLARLHDKVCCGGKISTSARKTVVGEETATHYQVTDPGEVSEGTKTALNWAMWIGVGMVTAGTGLAYYAAGHGVVASTTAAVAVNGVPIVAGMGASQGAGYIARQMGASELEARSWEVGVGTVVGLGTGLGMGAGAPRVMGKPTAPNTIANPVLRAAATELPPIFRLPGRGGAPGGKGSGEEGPPGGRPPGDGEQTQPIQDLELPAYTRAPGEQLAVDGNVRTGTRIGRSGEPETTIVVKDSPIDQAFGMEVPARISRPLKPAAELTGGKGDRFMVRREGFPNDPRFNQLAQEAVEGAGARVRNGEIKNLDQLLTDLGARRAEIARTMGDRDAGNFGLRRAPDQPDSFTPFVERYAYAYERAVRAGNVTAEINGTTVPMTKPGANFDGQIVPGWQHTSPAEIPGILRHAETLYARAMDPALPPEQTIATVAELQYYLSHAMPFNRGSAAVTDMVAKTIFDARGITTSPARVGVVVDIEALVTRTPQEFVANYRNFYEQPPGPAGGGGRSAPEGPQLGLDPYTRSAGQVVARTQAPEGAPPPRPPTTTEEAAPTGGAAAADDAKPGVDLPAVTREPGQQVVSTTVPRAALEIIKGLGPLQGKSVAEIRAQLTQEGFNQYAATNGGEIWAKPAGDNKVAIVRLDPADANLPLDKPAGRVPHAHKEIVNDNHWLGTDYKMGKQKNFGDDGVQINKGDPDGALKAHIPIDAPAWEIPPTP